MAVIWALVPFSGLSLHSAGAPRAVRVLAVMAALPAAEIELISRLADEEEAAAAASPLHIVRNPGEIVYTGAYPGGEISVPWG